MRHDRAFLTERIWQLKGEGLTGCAIARALHCPKTFVHKILNEGRLDLPRALAVTLRQTAHARGMTAQSLAEMVLRDGLASLTNAPATRVAPALREAA